MKLKAQLLFIALVIILILVGEALVHVPSPAPSGVVIRSYSSTSALVQALASGQVDVAPLENVAPQILSQLKTDPNLNLIPISNFGFTYIGFNLRNAPLNNTVFRQAMLYGFDRTRVINDVLAGYGESLSPGLFSSAYAALGWRNDSVDSYPYNPQKASQLLDSLGFTQSSGGVRIDPSTGEQLRTMFIFSKLSDPQAVAAANIFAQDMQEIGLPVISFPETNFDFYSQTSVTYYFDIYIETVSANSAPTWLYNLFAGVNDVSPAPLSTNLVGYHSQAFDTCSNELMTAANPTFAKAAALACQGLLGADLPAIPVYSKSLLIAERKGALNISPIAGSLSATLAASIANMTASRTITIGEVGGLSDINPTIALRATDDLILRLITTPLLALNANGSFAPSLIDGWQVSNNDTTLTLTLRSDSTFQGGAPITAHDLAATLTWLTTNMVPSTPLYSNLKTITGITELDDHRIQLTLNQPDYFAIDQIGNLFALPANLLPSNGGPLSLLLSGALDSSGNFVLVRFIQDNEADLQYAESWNSGDVLTVSGVQGQPAFGSMIGGSQIQITSQPLSNNGESIDNATFTVRISDGNGSVTLDGSYLASGTYRANLNLNYESLAAGNHRITTELYGQLPSGVVLQFGQQRLIVYSPQLMWQIVVYLLGILAVGFTIYRKKAVRKRARARARVRHARVSRARRPRRRN